MALGAFEAFTVVLYDQWFLACRTNQDVEKILSDHSGILRLPLPIFPRTPFRIGLSQRVV